MKHCISIKPLLLFSFFFMVFANACYVQKQTSIKVQFIETSSTFEVPGNSGAALINNYNATTGNTYQFKISDQSIKNFDIRGEMYKLGIDTVAIEKSISTLEVDSLWLTIDTVSLNTAGADFHYFNSLDLKLNSKKLGYYESANPIAVKQIVFQKGENLKSIILNSKNLNLSFSGVANSVPEKGFIVRLGIRIKFLAYVPINVGF